MGLTNEFAPLFVGASTTFSRRGHRRLRVTIGGLDYYRIDQELVAALLFVAVVAAMGRILTSIHRRGRVLPGVQKRVARTRLPLRSTCPDDGGERHGGGRTFCCVTKK